MSPHDAYGERMNTRYQVLVAAVESAINDADPIGLLKLGARLMNTRRRSARSFRAWRQ